MSLFFKKNNDFLYEIVNEKISPTLEYLKFNFVFIIFNDHTYKQIINRYSILDRTFHKLLWFSPACDNDVPRCKIDNEFSKYI